MKESWWAPKDIKFTREQVKWVIMHLEYMVGGYWPSEHNETGYEHLDGPQSGVKRAYFETPVAVAAEMTYRLQACDDGTGIHDGLLLEFAIASRYDDLDWLAARLATYYHTNIQDIHNRSRMALSFCQGFKRKETTYKEYKNGRESYLRKRNKVPA